MSDEFEIGGLASIGGLEGTAPSIEADEAEDANVCANCGARVTGEYCAECGQLVADFHRPILGLVRDSLADSLSLDGRIARTLPALLFRPGRITRAYLEGKRARYVPPFRLFLLASLLFFTALFTMTDRNGWLDGIHIVKQGDGGFQVLMGEAPGDGSDGEEMTPEEVSEFLTDDVEAAEDSDVSVDDLSNLVTKIFEDQKLIIVGIQQWAPRLSLLLLPIMAINLALLYAWRRKIYVYDHVIVSLHFQSWLYIGGTLLILLGVIFGGQIAWALFLIPFYLYRLLRETYQRGRFTTSMRVFSLVLVLMINLVVLSIGAMVVGYLNA